MSTISNPAALFDLVYNSLDEGNYETAQQLCLRPEIFRYTLGKALLSYTYSCTNNLPKALALAREVASVVPTEESVLNALSCTFKACKAEIDLIQCYENALKKQPTNESFMLELFNSYTRQRDGKKMQLMSQKLYKSKNNPSFIYWSVTCMLLQSDLPPTMLMVAEKMMYKALYENFPSTRPSAEELTLYLTTLLKQSKLSLALDALNELQSRPAGPGFQDELDFKQNVNRVRMHELFVCTCRIDLLVRMIDLKGAYQESRLVLKSFPDQWNVHKLMVEIIALVEQVKTKKPTENPSEPTDIRRDQPFPNYDFTLSHLTPSDLPEASLTWAQSYFPTSAFSAHRGYLLDLQTAYPKLRGPFLAELSLLSAFIRQNEPKTTFPNGLEKGESGVPDAVDNYGFPPFRSGEVSTAVEELCVLVSNFAVRFCNKQSCFSDLLPFLSAVCESNPTALNGLKEWALECKSTVDEQLNSRMDVVINPPVASSSKAEATAVSKEVEEGDQEDEKDQDEDGPSEGHLASARDGEPGSGTTQPNKKKKKKKKKKSGNKGASEGGRPAWLPKPDEHKKYSDVLSNNNDVLIMLCVSCKFDQIATFSEFQLTTGPDLHKSKDLHWFQPSRCDARRALYLKGKTIFKDGVGGEERTVLPGDELLQLNSTQHRALYSHALHTLTNLTNPAALPTASARAGVFVSALHWAAELHYAVQASPYSHVFKMDLIEVCRELGVGVSAHLAYKGLKARSVQYDTMSYLIQNVLLETCLWTEAIQLHRNVGHFHGSARKELLEMIAKCFEHGNYQKVMDLFQFVDRCERSTQKSLSECDLPLLDLAQKFFKKNLEGTKINEKIENPTEFISQLIDNFDFNIVVQVDQGPPGSASLKETSRKQAIRRHMRSSMFLSKFLRFFIEGDFATARSFITRAVEFFSNEAKPLGINYIEFDQNIQSCNSHTQTELYGLLETTTSLMFSTCCSILSHENPTEEIEKTLESIKILNDFILSPDLIYLPNVDGSINALTNIFSPEWVRCVSYTTLTFGTWIPLVLQLSLSHSSKQGEKREKETNNNRVTGKKEGDIIEGVAGLKLEDSSSDLLRLVDSVSNFLRKLQEQLTIVVERLQGFSLPNDAPSETSTKEFSEEISKKINTIPILQYLKNWKNHWKEHEPDNLIFLSIQDSEKGEDPLKVEEHLDGFAREMLSSHHESCSRLLQIAESRASNLEIDSKNMKIGK